MSSPARSRFWDGDGDGDSQSESEEEESADEDMHMNSRFVGGDDSDDEDDVKRVVRSHKDKHLEALGDLVDTIEQSIQDENFEKLADNFLQINSALVKWKKSSKSDDAAPNIYYEALRVIQEKLATMDKAAIKKLDKKQSKFLNVLTQKFKKNLVIYKTEFAQYKDKLAKGELYGDEEQDVGDNSSLSKSETEETESVDSPAVVEEEEEEEVEVIRKRRRKKKRGGTQPAPMPEPAAPVKIEWTEERVNEELKDILSGKAAGKKKLDKAGQIVKLLELMDKAKNVTQELSIRMNIISCHFDQTTTTKQHLSRENWMVTYNEIVTILIMLDKNRGIKLAETVARTETDDITASRLVAFLHRLKEEMYKAYKSIDPHSGDYLERLCDEELFLKLARHMHRYYNRINQRLEVAKVALLRMAVIHYRRDDLPNFPFIPVRNFKTPIKTFDDDEKDSEKDQQIRSEKLEKLLTIVCADGTGRMKTHAILYSIYHRALEKKFFEARDLMLLSHLQDQIQHTDVETQILYNRATAQLGLCAFRVGRVTDAHNCLSDLFQSNRVRELIAQGITPRYGDRNANPDQEKIEKQRKVPYHMHMNLELLEVVHLVSAMLLETPNMVTQGYDAKRKIVSRSFRRLTDICDRQVFAGPPESARDHVIAAARALKESDIEKAAGYLLGLNCWKLFTDANEVKDLLTQNIREVGLQTFLLRYSKAFSSVSSEFLAAKFSLPPKSVHRIVSRMMINEEIQSCWHQPSGTVVMHQVEPSKLQSLALAYGDKIDTLVSENERSFDTRTGGFGYDVKRSARDVDDNSHERKGGQGWGGNRDNRRDGGNKYRDGKNSSRGGGGGGYGRQEYRSWETRKQY